MNYDTVKSFAFSAGWEAMTWAPVAVGMLSNNPTHLLTAELAYAGMNLYAAYSAPDKRERTTAFSNAAISVASSCVFRPELSQHTPKEVKLFILAVLGVNNVSRGIIEVTSVIKDVAVKTWKIIRNQNTPSVDVKSTLGMIAGTTFRFGIGMYRVYAGASQLMYGIDSFPMNETKAISNDFMKGDCLSKSGKRHPLDVEFYDNAQPGTPSDDIRFILKKGKSSSFEKLYSFGEPEKYYDVNKEGRCDIILYLMSNELLIERNSMKVGPSTAAKLIDAGRVSFREIKVVKDICSHIDNIVEKGGRVKAVIIDGHGDPKSQRLTNAYQRLFGDATSSSLFSSELNVNTVFPKTGCLNNLEPHASIVLHGCSIGGVNPEGKENLADAIARQAYGRKVYAPKTDVTSFGMQVIYEKGLSFMFIGKPVDENGVNVTYIAQKK